LKKQRRRSSSSTDHQLQQITNYLSLVDSSMKEMRKCVILPEDGYPKETLYDPNNNNIDLFGNVMKTMMMDGTSIEYMKYFGFNLTLLYDECVIDKDTKINDQATKLMNGKGKLRGTCILLDNKIDIGVREWQMIQKIAKIIPNHRWIPEPIIERYETIQDIKDKEDELYKECILFVSRCKNKRYRDSIWSQIKDYCVFLSYILLHIASLLSLWCVSIPNIFE
jgi:hypothetical protein